MADPFSEEDNVGIPLEAPVGGRGVLKWTMGCAVLVCCLTTTAAASPLPANGSDVQASPTDDSATTWIMKPVAVDDGVDRPTIERIGSALRDAWSTAAQDVSYGRDELLARGAEPQLAVPSLDGAVALLAAGEEQYMSFEYATAASAFAEAAGRLYAHVGRLDAESLAKLCRARLLEGVAWQEEGNADAALGAFEKLIHVQPNYVADPALLPPASRTLFERARQRVRRLGVGRLEVISEPPGARVWLDSQLRGRTPLTVGDVPVGRHYLRVAARGRTSHTEAIEMSTLGHASTVELTPGPLGEVADRVVSSIRAGVAIAGMQRDLQMLSSGARFADIVLVAVATRDTQRLMLSAVRWTRGRRAAAVVVADLGPDMAAAALDVVHALRPGSWPPVQLPPDSRRLDVDFERAALGLGPGWGRFELADSDSLLTSWWLWTGAVAVVSGCALAYWALGRETEVERGPGSVQFSVKY